MTTTPDLRVPVGDLLARPGLRRALLTTATGVDLRLRSGGIAADDPVDLDLYLESIGDGVVVSGHVAARWAAECSRCLDPVEGAVDVAVHEFFEREPLDGETYPLDGDEIDLEPMVRDALAPTIPSVPLCDDACLGLCPACGADRNVATCACRQETTDPRWATLAEITFEGPAARAPGGPAGN